MIKGVRAGIYLGGDRLTVAVVPRRGGVQCFTVELEDLPGAHLKTELDARQLRLRRSRLEAVRLGRWRLRARTHAGKQGIGEDQHAKRKGEDRQVE